MNNVAELVTVSLDDPDVIKAQWNIQHDELKNILHLERNLLSLDDFNEYFKKLLKDIIDQIGLPYTQLILQYHDAGMMNDDKVQLSYIHFDTQRKCCITIPVIAKEPILFYDPSEENGYKKIENPTAIQQTAESIKSATPDNVRINYRNQNIGRIKKPNQVVTYSKKHPMLVNVSNLHSLFLMEIKDPRVLIQISYDFTFDDILKMKPEIFKVVEK